MSFLSRRRVLTSIIGFIVLTADNAFGAVGPTTKCRFVGQTTIFHGKKYTCIKSGSGKKVVLVWNKGVKIAPTPSAIAIASATPSPSLKPKPIISPIEIELGYSSDIKVGDTVLFDGRDAYGKLKSYAITRTSAGLIALDTVCTHEGCAVILEKKVLVCPCHISTFNSVSGAAESGPANSPLKKYQVKEVAGKIIVTD